LVRVPSGDTLPLEDQVARELQCLDPTSARRSRRSRTACPSRGRRSRRSSSATGSGCGSTSRSPTAWYRRSACEATSRKLPDPSGAQVSSAGMVTAGLREQILVVEQSDDAHVLRHPSCLSSNLYDLHDVRVVRVELQTGLRDQVVQRREYTPLPQSREVVDGQPEHVRCFAAGQFGGELGPVLVPGSTSIRTVMYGFSLGIPRRRPCSRPPAARPTDGRRARPCRRRSPCCRTSRSRPARAHCRRRSEKSSWTKT